MKDTFKKGSKVRITSTEGWDAEKLAEIAESIGVDYSKIIFTLYDVGRNTVCLLIAGTPLSDSTWWNDGGTDDANWWVDKNDVTIFNPKNKIGGELV